MWFEIPVHDVAHGDGVGSQNTYGCWHKVAIVNSFFHVTKKLHICRLISQKTKQSLTAEHDY